MHALRSRDVQLDLLFVLTLSIAGAYAASASACWSSPGDRGAANAASSPEDSVYSVKLKKYLGDSTVVDSLTKLVRTDSLYKLYRLALEPGKADVKLVAAVWCEELRLTLIHGPVPEKRAVDRMLDTVYRDHGIRDAFRYFAAQAPAEGNFDEQACGKLPPRSPIEVNGTRTDVEPYRPRPPRGR
jgi:hypothetical protein